MTVSTVLLFGLAALHPPEPAGAGALPTGLFPALLGELQDQFANAEADLPGAYSGAAGPQTEPMRQRNTDEDGESEIHRSLGSEAAPLAGSSPLTVPDQVVLASPSGRAPSAEDGVQGALEAERSGDRGRLAPDAASSRNQGHLSWPQLASPPLPHRTQPSGAVLRGASLGMRGNPERLAHEEALADAGRGEQPGTEGDAPEGQPTPGSPRPAHHHRPFATTYPAERGDARRSASQEALAGLAAADERSGPEETRPGRASVSAFAERNRAPLPWGTIAGLADEPASDHLRQGAPGGGNHLPELLARQAHASPDRLERDSSPAPIPWAAPSPPPTGTGIERDAAHPALEPKPAAPLPARAGEGHGGLGFELLLPPPRHRHVEPVATTEAAPPAERSAPVATLRVPGPVAATAGALVRDGDVVCAETSRFPATRQPSSSSVTFAAGETPGRSRAAADSPQAILGLGPGPGAPQESSPEPTRAPHHQTLRFPDAAAPVGEETQPMLTREDLERRLSAAPGSPKAWGTEDRRATGLEETGNAAILHPAGADVPRRAGATDSALRAREEAPSSGTLTRISPPEQAAGGAAVQGLRVTLSDEYTGRRVHVHLASSGDDVWLRLRTADPALRRELHEDLPRLAQRLEEAGYRPLPASEADPASLEHRFRGKGNEDPHGDSQNRDQRPPAGPDERGQSGRRRTRQQWMQAFAAAQD